MPSAAISGWVVASKVIEPPALTFDRSIRVLTLLLIVFLAIPKPIDNAVGLVADTEVADTEAMATPKASARINAVRSLAINVTCAAGLRDEVVTVAS